MSITRHIVVEMARALAVLAMVFLCFAGTSSASDGPVVQQVAGTGGALYTSLCGGDHGQSQLACHAPNACCRPDQAWAPPRTILPGPVYQAATLIRYSAFRADATADIAALAFRSRAPPV